MRPDFGHVVGVDIGETGTRAGLFDGRPRPVADEVRPVATAHVGSGCPGWAWVPGAGGAVIHAPTWSLRTA